MIQNRHFSVFIDQQIPRMRIAVRETVFKRQRRERFLNRLGDFIRVHFIFSHFFHVIDSGPVRELHRQHSLCAQIIVDFRHRHFLLLKTALFFQQSPHIFTILCLQSKIQLLGHVSSRLFRQPREPQPGNQIPQNRVIRLNRREIYPQKPRHRSLLNLHRHVFSHLRLRFVYLR